MRELWTGAISRGPRAHDTNQPAPGLGHRVVGFAVEEDGEKRLLHAQVDLSSTGYRESQFLREGSMLELEATR